MENKDLTTPQVAKILGVHRNTVAKLVKDGKLNPYRITEGTGRMRFKLEDVENFRDAGEIGQYQPNSIIKNHSVIVDDNAVPKMVKDILNKYEQEEFALILECANINRIFGGYMRSASPEGYAKALDGKSNTWIGETYLNITSREDKNKYDSIRYIVAGRKLGIAIGSVSFSEYHKPSMTSLIFHGEKGDIVISGTLQQFYVLEKGLPIMKREHAESFFTNFKEIPVSEFSDWSTDEVYNNFMKRYTDSVFDIELDDDDEE